MRALVVLVECAAAGMLVAAVVFAAGIASGASASTPLVLLATTIAVGVAFLGWREQPSSAARVVRRVDRRAGLDGALCAVLECDVRRTSRASAHDAHGTMRDTDVPALLAARVRRRLGPTDFWRAALPRTPIAVLAPLLAVALIAFAIERGPSPQHVSVDSGLAGSAAALRDDAAHIRADGDARGADALEIAARRIDAIAERDARAGANAADPTTRRDARAELRRAAQAPELSARARAALAAAAEALDSLALDSSVSDSDRTTPGQPPAARGDSGAGIAGQPAAAGEPPGGARVPGGTRPEAETSGRDPLANASGDGRMLGPPAGGESEPRADDAPKRPIAGGGAGRGVVSARWWPSRYDAVVERYLTP